MRQRREANSKHINKHTRQEQKRPKKQSLRFRGLADALHIRLRTSRLESRPLDNHFRGK
jgi:hypothetical protein